MICDPAGASTSYTERCGMLPRINGEKTPKAHTHTIHRREAEKQVPHGCVQGLGARTDFCIFALVPVRPQGAGDPFLRMCDLDRPLSSLPLPFSSASLVYDGSTLVVIAPAKSKTREFRMILRAMGYTHHQK